MNKEQLIDLIKKYEWHCKSAKRFGDKELSVYEAILYDLRSLSQLPSPSTEEAAEKYAKPFEDNAFDYNRAYHSFLAGASFVQSKLTALQEENERETLKRASESAIEGFMQQLSAQRKEINELKEGRELVEEALRVLKLRRPTTPGLGASINLLELFLNK